MTSSDQSVEDKRTENQMLKEEMDKMRQEMKEMQLALARVQKVPDPPVTPTLPPGHTPEYLPPGPSTSFPSHQYYQGRNAYDPQASQPNQNPPPPNISVFVTPPPATLQRSSSEPLFQAHDNQYYPPEPTFKAPEPHTYNTHFEILVETEKPAKSPEQDEVLRKFKSMEQSVRNIHGLGNQVSVAYKDLSYSPTFNCRQGSRCQSLIYTRGTVINGTSARFLQ
ncbi:splicing factor-like protein 1 [Nicotiana sylvestris]|uniref:splicing factor-like protein 1 n=1 Tax=Nicotiana sylvestris TaxID=4096 RepID=UPI00388CA843